MDKRLPSWYRKPSTDTKDVFQKCSIQKLRKETVFKIKCHNQYLEQSLKQILIEKKMKIKLTTSFLVSFFSILSKLNFNVNT